MKTTLSLRGKYLGFQLAAVGLLLASFAIFEFHVVRNALYKQVEESATSLSELLQQLIVENPQLLNANSLQPVIYRFEQTLPLVSKVSIVDYSLRKIADSDPKETDHRGAEETFAEVIARSETRSDIYESNGLQYLRVTSPLMGAYDPIRKSCVAGAVSIEVPLWPIDQKVSKNFLYIMVVLITLTTAFGAIQLFFTQRRLIRPLLSLSSVARRIGDGDLSARFPRPSNDEIGKLASTFNLMAVEVEKANKELQAEITQRQQAEEEIREKTGALENAAEGIARLDTEGKYMSVNQAYAEMLGQTPKEMIGMAPTTTHAEDQQKMASAYQQMLHTGRVEVEAKGERRDGSVFHKQLVMVSTYNPEGKFAGHFCFMKDISERKRLEVELEQARDAALESARLKSEFLANMSHEIRTPLNGVTGMLGLLLDSQLNKSERELAEMARSSAESLLSIINDILDFSKIEAGKLEIERVPLDLRALVEEAIGIVTVRADEKNLELIVRFSPTAPRYVISDPGRIRQCLLNLLSNAIKFTEQGYVYLDVEAETQSGNQMTFRFSVTDTGIGIPSDKLDHIFERFTQVDSSLTRNAGGTGLGLAITKRLVGIMGGTADVASDQGKGSTFRLNLPLPINPNTKEPAGPPELADVRIMIVSQNEINRRVLHEQIISWRMRNGSCGSGEEALKRLRMEDEAGDPYQLVLIDYHLSDMDGLTLGQLIKADASLRTSKLVLLTSVRQPGDIDRANQLGFSAYLMKPVRQSQLMDTLASVWLTGPAISREIITAGASPSNRKELPYEKGNARVLVVDDNAINQKVAQLALQRLGCRVDLAADGIEAVEMTRDCRYDLVFMDCEMPVMDGFRSTAAIRHLENGSPRLPIVAMTARALEGDRQECLRAGMDDYISKPLRLEDFARALNRWAGLRRKNGKSEKRESELEAESVIGMNDLARLRSLIPGEAALSELFDAFIDQGKDLISQLHIAVGNNDAAELRRLAHKLLGASASLGASPMSQICKQLEEQGRTTVLRGAIERVSELEQELTRIESFLSSMPRTEQEDLRTP